MNELRLFWIDKNWKNRGYARNRILVVDYESKTFDYSSTCWVPYAYNVYSQNFIEVVRLSDIKNFIKNLENNGFKQKK